MRNRRLLGLVLVVALAAPGCSLPSSPLMATVPRAWRDQHPFGPEANAARSCGELQPRFVPRRAEEWAALAHDIIEEGDVLFRFGRSYTPNGRFTSWFIASISDSRFSHDAIAHWEGDVLYVYDAEQEGIRKVPFVLWMLDVKDGTLEIKRLKPAYRGGIPQAIAYCEDVYLQEVPFDFALKPDDERLYCSEMIEKAFRSAGLPLAEPLPIRCLPHYPRYSPLRPVVERFTEYRVDVPVFAIGNEHYGTYGSPYLELVYRDPSCNANKPRKPPRCGTCCPASGGSYAPGEETPGR
jgi:hypothetical protein